MLEIRNILIIEDNELNRELLVSILEDRYRILTASDGAAGIDILRQSGDSISLILLDIQMPVMDGYEFLRTLQRERLYNNIPIIVTTASNTIADEIQCLELGATDFVTKPYNARIVRKRVESLIRLCETTTLLHRIEHDPVTGTYTREVFMELVSRRLKAAQETQFDLVSLEIEDYPLLHERYGTIKCNEMLNNIVHSLREALPDDAILGRIENSRLAFMIPHISFERHKAGLTKCLQRVQSESIADISVKCGLYECVNPDLPAETICGNALIALETTRRSFGLILASFDDSMRQKIIRERYLLSQIQSALADCQFIAYYQPKYDVFAEKIAGAEALIRWIHPKMGFMSPGEFIPLLEHNGLIGDVDRYMLEAVCRNLRGWLDEGLHPVPVSVNISQADFDQTNLADVYEEIVDRYGVDHRLIHFEITETVHAVDARKKYASVLQFREKGFQIELDDFGAGYSSLNSLGELPIDIIKVDMGLIRNMFDAKYQSILRGALLTAHDLRLGVVSEGVENADQVAALKKLCAGNPQCYIQGYFFSKPLPPEQFVQFIKNNP